MTPRSRRGVAILVATAALAACGDDANSSEATTAATTGDVTSPAEIEAGDPGTSDAVPTTTAAQAADEPADAVAGLSADEVAGLLWMREEEQMAHDLYARFHELWELRIFENITASEEQHIDVTIDLLDRFEIDDPARGLDPGTFDETRIQALYDDLVAQGTETELAALHAGALVEELDIDDLRARAAATDNAVLDDAYARLERASRNHLRAFVSQIEARGDTYTAQILDDLDAIVAQPMERGHGA